MTESAYIQWNPSDPCEAAVCADGRSESAQAHQALLDYLRLGAGRSQTALLARYQQLESPPTLSHGTLRKWSSHFEWGERAAAYDAIEEERTRAEMKARREAIMQRGLALEHERVVRLVALFERLDALAAEEDAFWIRDVRVLRLPDGSQERIEKRRFNGALVRSLRGLLDDIAAETGGRPIRSLTVPAQQEEQEDEPRPEDYTLDVFTPAERAEYLRLQHKLFGFAE